jgi:phosphatidylserine/phosphatidylglycerophosphate/cardiolipin synthase-like enzyme
MFQNPYVILRKDIAAALRRASYRGVKLLLHTNGPASTNHLITQAYFLKDWKNMMRDMPTLRIFVTKAGRTLHSKNFVIDGEVASVGTYNLDPLSTDINSELIAVVHSRDFAERLSLRMLREMSEGIEYSVRRNEDGILEEVVGPSQEVNGRVRALLGFVRRIPFLRSLL